MGVGSQRHAPAALPLGKTRYPLYRRLGGGGPGSVWTSAENLAPTGIRSPDRPAVASSYTDWAIPANKTKHKQVVGKEFNIIFSQRS